MHIIVLITAANQKEADKIAKVLVKNKLAACVNRISNLRSIFRWKGELDQAKEALLIVKSRKEKLNKIIKAVRSAHSYTLPEIIAIPVISGFKPYLKWIDESLR